MQDQTEPRLKHFPITFFAIVMGLMGLTLALHAAAPVSPLAGSAGRAVLWIGIAAAAAIAATYLAKALRYPGQVAWEWRHPVRLAYFPTITISLLLMATALAAEHQALARTVWHVGVVGQGLLTVAVINGWISHRLLYTEKASVMCPLPLFHVFACYPIVMGALASGAHMVFPTPQGYRGEGVFDNFWKLCERWKTTFIITVPTAVSALMQKPVNADLSTVKNEPLLRRPVRLHWGPATDRSRSARENGFASRSTSAAASPRRSSAASGKPEM